MGFMDGFTSDGTVDMKHTEYYNLMKEAAKAELLSNAVKAEVPGFYIQANLQFLPLLSFLPCLVLL